MTQERIEAMRRRYPPGTEVTLNSMEGESHMPPGLKGKVDIVDDAGQIHVKLGEWKQPCPRSWSGQLPHHGSAESREAKNSSHPGNKQPEVRLGDLLAGLPVNLVGQAILIADAIQPGRNLFG